MEIAQNFKVVQGRNISPDKFESDKEILDLRKFEKSRRKSE